MAGRISAAQNYRVYTVVFPERVLGAGRYLAPDMADKAVIEFHIQGVRDLLGKRRIRVVVALVGGITAGGKHRDDQQNEHQDHQKG